MTTKTVWETLSAVDVSHLVQNIGGRDYIAWMDAWAELKNHFPDAECTKSDEPQIFPDTSGFVHCTIRIPSKNFELTDSRPILNGNKPIFGPNAQQINSAYQRCMVKTIAMCGLGWKLWQKADDLLEDTGKTSERSPDAIASRIMKARNEI